MKQYKRRNLLYMNQLYQTHPENQVKSNSAAKVAAESHGIDQIKDNLTLNQGAVLRALLVGGSNPFYSQLTLAAACKISDKTVRRILMGFRAMGILSWKQRWNTSNVYSFSGILRRRKDRARLRRMLVGFFMISLLSPYYSYGRKDNSTIAEGVLLKEFKEFNLTKKAAACF